MVMGRERFGAGPSLSNLPVRENAPRYEGFIPPAIVPMQSGQGESILN